RIIPSGPPITDFSDKSTLKVYKRTFPVLRRNTNDYSVFSIALCGKNFLAHTETAAIVSRRFCMRR
ncbi:MAG: hypothetical protein KAI17_24770, partial [Thiotrichaceae bacterium]|nr:hypothetical protein [Thiotrichaceae bacterium]